MAAAPHDFEMQCAYHEAGHAIAQIYYFDRGLKQIVLPPYDPSDEKYPG